MKEFLPGQRFQGIVAMLARQFSHDDKTKVESPKWIIDKDTGHKREHDILITHFDHHGEYFTAIECKDRGRPVTVPDIEAFSKKAEKTGIHRAIIVSANGFSEDAKTKAATLNMFCIEFSQVESFPWFRLSEPAPKLKHRFEHVSIWAVSNETPKKPFSFFDQHNRPIDRSAVENILRHVLPEEDFQALGGSNGRKKIVLEGTGVYFSDGDGKRIEEPDIHIEYELYVERDIWEFKNYIGSKSGYEVAINDFNFAGIDLRFMITKENKDRFIISLSKLK